MPLWRRLIENRRGALRSRARPGAASTARSALVGAIGHACASVSWVMNCIRRSWVASARGTSPVIRPGRQGVDAVADAEQLGQLGGDDQHRLPLVGEPVDDRVDLVLGADVDAAGRLVEDQHVRVGEDPLRQHDLLLVAAGELAGDARDARRLDVHALRGSPRRPGTPRCRRPSRGGPACRGAAAEMLRLMSSIRFSPYRLRSSVAYAMPCRMASPHRPRPGSPGRP